MFRPAARVASNPAAIIRHTSRTCRGSRFISTAPPHQKSRSWKSSAARWGLAGAIVYYYNTSVVFADEPRYVRHAPPEVADETETYATVDAVAEQRKIQAQASQAAPNTSTSAVVPDDAPVAPGSPEELEAEASQEGAFNEETGEINWDCPCLGGMAYGPCGEQFRAAFSCFVFSKEEPKGVDCIDRFKAMQDCFREHPDVYGSELEMDEEEVERELDAQNETPIGAAPDQSALSTTPRNTSEPASGEKVSQQPSETAAAVSSKRERAQSAKEQVSSSTREDRSEASSIVPKSAHDAR